MIYYSNNFNDVKQNHFNPVKNFDFKDLLTSNIEILKKINQPTEYYTIKD
jgi:hypothetical protein